MLFCNLYYIFWRYTNSKTVTKNHIMSLYSDPKDQNSNLIDNSREKANILNFYFASVYTIEPIDDIPRLTPEQSKLKITVEMVKGNLRCL